MLARQATILRVLTFALSLGILVTAGAIVRHLIISAGDTAPRTELERAVFAAEEAVRANPEDPTARIKLASAYLEQDALRSALEQAEVASRLAPDDPAVYYIKGLVQSKSGDHEDAVKTLTRAVETEGQLAGFYIDAWAALARAYERSGDDEKALEAMNKAIDYGPENAVLLYERGQMYERQDKFADAVLDYVFALNYVSDYEPAKEAYERIASKHPEAVEEAREKYEIDKIPSEMSGGEDESADDEKQDDGSDEDPR